MASGDYDTKITLGMEADLTGGVQTEKELDQLKRKAREFGKEGESSLGQVQQAVGKLQKSIGFLRSALTGFGAVGAIMGLVGAIGKIKDAFAEAKKKADELAKARENAEHKKAVEDLAKSYEELEKATQKAAAAVQHANAMQDIATKNARALEDAQMDLSEQKELSAVDASDPAAAEKRAEISARYAARRGLLTTSREREDIDAKRNRLAKDAGAKRKEANQIEAAMANDDRLIASTKERRRLALNKSQDLNYEDRIGAWENGFGIIGDAFSRWGSRFGDQKTSAGDAIREKAAEDFKKLDAELKRLEKEKKARLERVAKLRTEAQQLDEEAVAVYKAQEVVDVKETTARVTGQRGMDDAETSLENKNKEIAKKKAKEEADRATIAQGPGRIAAIEKQIAATEAQQCATKQADAKEQMDAVLAQQALDSFNAAGHRRNGTGVQKQRSALEADVERETREATQSRAQLQSTLATLAATLKGLNADLNKVKREVDAATKRQAAVNDEAPEG